MTIILSYDILISEVTTMHDIRQMGAFQYFFILGLMSVSFPLSFLLLICAGFSTTFEKYAEIADIIVANMFELEKVEEEKERKE